MNCFKIWAFSTAFASVFSFGGLLNIYPVSGKSYDTYGSRLSAVDSVTFKKVNDNLQLNLKKGKKTVKNMDVKKIAAMSVAVRDSCKEFMTIHEKGDPSKIDTLMLKDVQSLEFYTMDDQIDEDGDSIPDFDEKFLYETNPKDSDTDGDGWNDKEEIMMYNAKYPLSWNPKIANIPQLSVELVKTPDIILNVSINENETESRSISTGETNTSILACTKSSTTSSQLQKTLTDKIGFSSNVELGGTGITKMNIGYSSDITSALASGATKGATWSETNTKNLTNNYNKAETETQSQGKTISGSSIFMQLKLKNKGNITYAIENIAVAASIVTPQGEKINISELYPCGDTETGKIGVLGAGDSTTTLFCNRKVPRKFTEDLISNPGILFTDAIEKTLTYKWPNSTTSYDFTHTYTKVAAKTAHISVDYGPQPNKIEKFKDFHVSTNHRLNSNVTSIENIYEKISLAQALKIAKINFEEGEIFPKKELCPPDIDSYYGVKSIDGVSYNSDRNAFWSIMVKNYNNPDEVTIYSPFQKHGVLDSIFISSGDEIMISYNEDKDGDKVPLSVEMMYGTSDNIEDTDGDGLNDGDEIYGWPGNFVNGYAVVKTNPMNPDTDGDGIRDDIDDDPLNRAPYSNNNIDSIQVINAVSSKETNITVTNNISYRVTDICDSSMIVKIKTETPVNNVKVVYNKNEYKITAHGNEFNVKLPTKTSEKFMTIIVTSEEGKEKSYTVNLGYALDAPTHLQINTQNSKDNLTLSFVHPNNGKGSLIDGYIIVRGDSPDSSGSIDLKSLNKLIKDPEDTNNNEIVTKLNFDNRTALNTGMVIGKGLSIVAILPKDENSFTDRVGFGSPYYSYRVYAYRYENNTYLYSEGSNVVTKSIGRIKGYFKLLEIGTEYLYDAFDGRYDMRVRADIYAGNKLLKGYNYWFRNAGNAWYGNTIIWEKAADDVTKLRDCNCIPLDTAKHPFEIGSEGLSIILSNHADVNDEFIDTKKQVNWPYDKMAAALNGNLASGMDGDAPLNDKENLFIWGTENVCYNFTSNCNIGDEPHSGYKIKFHYEWVDKDE